MYSFFCVSFTAVLKLVLATLVGCALAKAGILDETGRHRLGKLIVNCMLPAMLVSSLGAVAADSQHAVGGTVLICFLAPIIAGLGIVVAQLLNRLFRVPVALRPLTAMAVSLGNAGYLPLPLFAVICATADIALPDRAASSLLCSSVIALFLVSHSPMQWLFIFPYLAGTPIREIKLRNIISVPVIASLTGILLAFTPLHRLIFTPDAPLHIVHDTLALLAQGVFPCALLLLGANLMAKIPPAAPAAANAPAAITEPLTFGAYASVILGKLVILPAIGFFIIKFCWQHEWISQNPLVALVLMIQFAVPPATNLVIMCQANQRGEQQMARLLFVAYCVCVVTLTLWLTFFLLQVSK